MIYRIFILMMLVLFTGCWYGDPIKVSLVMIDRTGLITTQFEQGKQITFIIVATNPTAKNEVLCFSSNQKYDIMIYDINNILVWNWANDMLFSQFQTELNFNPYETFVFIESWNQQSNNNMGIPLGVYSVYIEELIGTLVGPYQVEILEST